MDTPTPFADLNALLGDLSRSVRAILGADFVGAYLQGSFAVGDADRHGDVDFLVVVERDLATAQVERLQAMHERLHDGPIAWAANLEGRTFLGNGSGSSGRRTGLSGTRTTGAAFWNARATTTRSSCVGVCASTAWSWPGRLREPWSIPCRRTP